MILEARPSQIHMEQALRDAGYTRTAAHVPLANHRRGHEEAPREPAVDAWTNRHTGDTVMIRTTGDGAFYNWELYLPVGGMNPEENLRAFREHVLGPDLREV